VLACLNRLHDLNPSCELRGSIRLDGQEILRSGLEVLTLRRRVGLIVQRSNPLPLSISPNLTFPCGTSEWAATPTARTPPSGPCSSVSAGPWCWSRRCCCSTKRCTALDPLASGVVEELVFSLRSSVTIQIVTHNLG
jgi:phosphate transport system ATP-binding protein